ncbi:MAG TPA: hypothetical protein DCS97_14090 [Planctomycetes bacterium]|nr:hypothetical protein [Planctomycetota bacterium]
MRQILCLVSTLCLTATASAADWKAPAVFDLTTEVVAPNPGAWTATMGTMPGANTIMLGGGFEGIHRRTLVIPERDAADTIHLSYHTMTEYDTYAESYYDGARVRVYRIIDGAFTLVRTDTVPKGGARASGWMSQAVIKAGVTEYRHGFAGWVRPDYDYTFAVTAIDTEGNESGPSNLVRVRKPAKGAEGIQIPNQTINLQNIPPEDRSEREAPAVPTGFALAGIDETTGIMTFTWQAVAAPDLAGYRVQMSNTDPVTHKGYGLDLAGKATNEREKIRHGDFVFVDLDKPTMSRLTDWSPRVFNTYAAAPPANLLFHPDEDPAKSWAFVPHPGPLPAEFADPGAKCLKITVAPGAVAEAREWKFGSKTQDYLMVLPVGKPIVIEVWMKSDKPTDDVSFTFRPSGHGWQPELPVTWKATPTWKKHSIVVTPTTEYTSDIAGELKWEVTGKGTMYLDNLRMYWKDRPFMAPAAEEIAALKTSHLHAIRTHAFIKSGSSYSMKSLLGGAGETTIGGDETLGNQLKVFASLGINPWLQIEMHMSAEEWAGLVEYLAAPYDPAKGDTPAKKPWAAMRFKQGQAKPWSEVFAHFYFEISNETWNTPFAPWTFLNRSATDASTGITYTDGQLLGLWQNQVNAALKASPYWKAIAPKWETSLCGWYVRGGEDGYAQSAAKLCPDARHITTAPYNGGWDEGAVATTADDNGRFLALTFTPQRGDRLSRDLANDVETLRIKGINVLPGTYEAGPGYSLPGTVNAQQIEAEAQVMKSLAGGAATLDSFLNAATYGFRLQNLFVYGRGRGFWATHAAIHVGGQPYPWYRACTELYNAHGTGDFLRVNTRSVPTWDLAATATRQALAAAPLVGTYLTRQGDRFHLFVISRKLDNFPVVGDDGFTPVTLNLPFTSAKGITLRKMSGDPRATNLDADLVKIQEQQLPATAFARAFILDAQRGADARGLPPASIFMYTFTGCGGIVEAPPAPPAFRAQPVDIASTEGLSAALEVEVQSALPRTFLLQWQRQRGTEWIDVPGGVTPQLRFNEMAVADDGAVFRCRLSDTLLREPLFSQTAKLAVKPFVGPVFPQATAPPTGAADAQWAKAAVAPLNQLFNSAPPAATATVRGLWDEQSLHLLLEVTDPEVQDSAGRAWSGDGVEVFIDALNSKLSKYGREHTQFYAGFTTAKRPEYANGSNSTPLQFSKLPAVMARTATGWSMQLTVPWAQLGGAHRSFIGLDLALIDRNAAGTTLKRTLADSKGQAWMNPASFGTAKLAKP